MATAYKTSRCKLHISFKKYIYIFTAGDTKWNLEKKQHFPDERKMVSYELNKKIPRGIGPRRFFPSPWGEKCITVTQDMSPSGVNFVCSGTHEEER